MSPIFVLFGFDCLHFFPVTLVLMIHVDILDIFIDFDFIYLEGAGSEVFVSVISTELYALQPSRSWWFVPSDDTT